MLRISASASGKSSRPAWTVVARSVQFFFLRSGEDQTELRLGFGMNRKRLALYRAHLGGELVDLGIGRAGLHSGIQRFVGRLRRRAERLGGRGFIREDRFRLLLLELSKVSNVVSRCTRRSIICSAVGGVPPRSGRPCPCAWIPVVAANASIAATKVFFMRFVNNLHFVKRSGRKEVDLYPVKPL